MKYYTSRECQTFLDSAKKLISTKQTIQDIFEVIVNSYSKETAAIYFDDKNKIYSYSYAEYKNKTLDIASKLSSLLANVEKGSVVGLKLPNCHQWSLIFWAICMCGFKPLLIDVRANNAVTAGLLVQASAKAIISNDHIALNIPNLNIATLEHGNLNPHFEPTWENQVIFCSSGTTGNAKLFVYEGSSLCGQILASLDIPQQSLTLMHPGEIRILGMVPFHHVFGFMVVFLWYQFYGKTVVYPKSINSRDLTDACKLGKVTHVFSVPLFWDGLAQTVNRTLANQPEKTQLIARRMINYNTGKIGKRIAGLAATEMVKKKFQKKILGSQIQYCISGGGYIDPKTLTLINGLGYPLYNGFGMTEIGITSVEQSVECQDRLLCSIGKPFHGVNYKIKNNAEQGELLVKAASMHKGRLVNGEFVPIELDEDGFFATGDIAEIHGDGRCYIKGRLKDVIINANGENIYPDELESYFKDIRHTVQNVVLGVKENKGSNRETVTLVVEIDPSVNKTDYELIEHDFKTLNSKLPTDRRIEKSYIYKEKLPLANGMKVKRYIIKQSLESKDFSLFMNWDGSKLSSNETKVKQAIDFSAYHPLLVRKTLDKIKQIWSDILVVPVLKIEDSAHFDKDLGGDSMMYVAMVQDLNSTFNIDIPMEEYGNLMTTEEFALEVLKLTKAREKKTKKN